MSFKPTSTIAAVATAPGDGGVSIVRLSGPRAIFIANQVTSKDLQNLPSHHLVFTSVLQSNGEALDTGLVVVMKAPHSYTGEDVVEFQGHGGHFLTQKVLKRFCEAGATFAKAGEFTERAFLNGKMDLAQAEAVQSLIAAKNEYALKWASKQLEGGLSQKIKHMQDKLIEHSAILEAWVDFPEEGLEFISFKQLLEHLKSVLTDMQKLMSTYRDGKKMQEGLTLCLVGRPNVGKSSLMNALLKKDRALVTPLAGTTRDTLEETLLIQGVPYHLIDTAGVRETDEIIEKLGIERTLKSAHEADLVLWVLDSSEEFQKEDEELLKQIQTLEPVLVLWNKIDLGFKARKKLPFENQISLSAHTKEGLDALFEKISELTLKAQGLSEEITLTQERHLEALQEASHLLEKVIEDLENQVSPEWVTFDLKSALKSLGKIMGFDLTESLLSEIFSRFCIGK